MKKQESLQEVEGDIAKPEFMATKSMVDYAPAEIRYSVSILDNPIEFLKNFITFECYMTFFDLVLWNSMKLW